MSLETFLEETLRRVVREELRAALAETPRAAEDRRVTYSDAASAAGVSVPTIRAWKKAGRLHAFGEGRNTRFSLAEVLAVTALPSQTKQTPGERAEEIYRSLHG